MVFTWKYKHHWNSIHYKWLWLYNYQEHRKNSVHNMHRGWEQAGQCWQWVLLTQGSRSHPGSQSWLCCHLPVPSHMGHSRSLQIRFSQLLKWFLLCFCHSDQLWGSGMHAMAPERIGAQSLFSSWRPVVALIKSYLSCRALWASSCTARELKSGNCSICKAASRWEKFLPLSAFATKPKPGFILI